MDATGSVRTRAFVGGAKYPTEVGIDVEPVPVGSVVVFVAIPSVGFILVMMDDNEGSIGSPRVPKHRLTEISAS